LSAYARSLQVRCGFASATGRRPDNQDFGAWLETTAGLAAAIADGVGGHKGGRVAAETVVRGFLDAYPALPETLGIRRAASHALESLNAWIYAQGRTDAALANMATTLSALILSGRTADVLHVGDSRIYRLDADGLERLTQDHTLGRGDLAHVLNRAVGFEPSLKLDHRALGLRQHDRFLLCTDGVHGPLSDAALRRRLAERSAPAETARALVEAALAAGGDDNATALVIDVIDLPAVDVDELGEAAAALPILPLPKPGETIDGFRLMEVISDGRYSRLFRAQREEGGALLALKFPHPRVAADASYRLAFVREAWVAARVRSPFVGEVVAQPPGRQSRLYTVMPFYEGETLERRLTRERIGLAEGVEIAVKIARALDALHRARVAHRDVKPDNVILAPDGGLRLVDLGVATAERLAEFPAADIPGTPSFMAPEMFQGAYGDAASDLYALGVTVYRMFARAYPYGEIEPFMHPRFDRYHPLTRARPDLPAWLDAAIAKAVAVKPEDRFGDALEFAYELELGLKLAAPRPRARPPLIEREPLLVWKAATLLLAVALAALLAVFASRGGR